MSGGARYEIAIGGTPRTYRDTIEGAWAAATNSEDETEAAASARKNGGAGQAEFRGRNLVLGGGYV
jgi:hypothetical protein